MKIFKKGLLAIIVVLSAIVISPVLCSNSPVSYSVEAASVKINTKKYTMYKGDKYTLKIAGTKKKVKWSTSNNKIATVNEKGKVTAKKKGKATITAKVGKKKYKCKITVKNVSTGQKNALNKAKQYIRILDFSEKGLASQLEYHKFKSNEISYAIKHCGANWKKEALGKAKSYLEVLDFSKKGLREQLEFEKFTKSQIDYALKNCKADWNKEAAGKAKSYQRIFSFSKQELKNQLEYDGFTDSQIAYALKAVGY